MSATDAVTITCMYVLEQASYSSRELSFIASDARQPFTCTLHLSIGTNEPRYAFRARMGPGHEVAEPTDCLKQIGQLVAHLQAVERTAPQLTQTVNGSIDRQLFDRVTRETSHGHRGRRMRVIGVGSERTSPETEFLAHLPQSPDGFPEPLGHVGLGAETADQFQRQVELISDLPVEFRGGVAHRQEENRQGRDQEVVERDLLRPIDVGRLIQPGQDLHRVFSDIDHRLRVAAVLRDPCWRVEDRPVDEDPQLVHPEVQHDAQASETATGGFAVPRGLDGVEFQCFGYLLVPLQDLIVQVSDFVTPNLGRALRTQARIPNLRTDTIVGYHAPQIEQGRVL